MNPSPPLATKARNAGLSSRLPPFDTSAVGRKPPIMDGQSVSALPGNSDINLFGNSERVINLDAKIADRALDLSVAEQELRRSQVYCASVA